MIDEYVSPPFKLRASLVDEIKKQFGPLLNVGDKTAALGQEIILLFNAQQHENLKYAAVSYLLFTQAFRTISTIRVLCRIGCGIDSLSLCASLFENYVDLCYIGKAPYKRSRRYLEFEQVDKYYKACRILQHRRLPKGWRKQYRDYKADLWPQVRNTLKHFSDRKRKFGWSGRSLAERARAIQQGFHYEQLYWVFCGYKHTLPFVAGGLVRKRGQHIDLVYMPSPQGVGDAAEYSTAYFLDLCQEFQRRHGLGKGSEIKTLSDELESAVAKVRRAQG